MVSYEPRTVSVRSSKIDKLIKGGIKMITASEARDVLLIQQQDRHDLWSKALEVEVIKALNKDEVDILVELTVDRAFIDELLELGYGVQVTHSSSCGAIYKFKLGWNHKEESK